MKGAAEHAGTWVEVVRVPDVRCRLAGVEIIGNGSEKMSHADFAFYITPTNVGIEQLPVAEGGTPFATREEAEAERLRLFGPRKEHDDPRFDGEEEDE